MRCQYCDKRLGITKRLKGDTFCSLEHQELYFNAQSNEFYDRLAAAAETPITAVQENQATPEIAALAEAVERTAASELRQEPSVVDQPAPLLGSYAAESKSGTVESPVTSAQEALAQRSSVLVVDVSPAEPAVDVTPSAGQTTWPSVPPGYPPIAVSSSSTLLLDPSGADFIPTLKGTPYPGEAPAWLFQTQAIETPPRPPVLPSGQPEARLNPERSTLPAHAPQSTPLEVGWVPRLGVRVRSHATRNLVELSRADAVLRSNRRAENHGVARQFAALRRSVLRCRARDRDAAGRTSSGPGGTSSRQPDSSSRAAPQDGAVRWRRPGITSCLQTAGPGLYHSAAL